MKKIIASFIAGAVVVAIPIAFAMPVPPVRFSDVNEGDWYYEVVTGLVQSGYASGYSDNTFRPNNPITRAEMAKIFMKLDSILDYNRTRISELKEKVEILESKISTLSFPGDCYYNDKWYSAGDSVENQNVSSLDTFGKGSCTCEKDGSLSNCQIEY